MIVSHSNMKSYQKCPMKFYFDVKLNLKPKQYPDPIIKGLFGHDMMETFFKEILESNDYDKAVEACNDVLVKTINDVSDPLRLEKSKVYRNVLAFGAYFVQQPWRVLEVEQNTNWPISTELDVSFGFTPDLVCEWTQGPKRGLPFVLDYKFTGQYWNDRQINVVQQMLKYLIYYNKMHNAKMRHAGIVMLNTRAKNDDDSNLFLLKWLPVSKEKLQVIERDNERLVHQIEPFFRMSAEEYYENHATRTTDELTCKTCWYADDLCPMDMNGQDLTKTIETQYEKNDYGYN